MSRRALQVTTGVLALIPLTTGALGLMGLDDPLYTRLGAVVPNVVLDTNLRFLSGLWFGLGVVVCWMIPRIERETVLYRAAWAMIFAGGLGRLVSLVFAGAPPPPVYGAIALEILGAPVFVLWQARVARAAALGGQKAP